MTKIKKEKMQILIDKQIVTEELFFASMRTLEKMISEEAYLYAKWKNGDVYWDYPDEVYRKYRQDFEQSAYYSTHWLGLANYKKDFDQYLSSLGVTPKKVKKQGVQLEGHQLERNRLIKLREKYYRVASNNFGYSREEANSIRDTLESKDGLPKNMMGCVLDMIDADTYKIV